MILSFGFHHIVNPCRAEPGIFRATQRRLCGWTRNIPGCLLSIKSMYKNWPISEFVLSGVWFILMNIHSLVFSRLNRQIWLVMSDKVSFLYQQHRVQSKMAAVMPRSITLCWWRDYSIIIEWIYPKTIW